MNLNLRSSSFDIISCLPPVGCLILIRSRLRLKDDHNKLLWVTKISKITKTRAQHGIHSTENTLPELQRENQSLYNELGIPR